MHEYGPLARKRAMPPREETDLKSETNPSTAAPAAQAEAFGVAVGDMWKSVSGLNLPMNSLAQLQSDYLKSAT